MADNDVREGEDEPLDPAMERVRTKMVRLLAVSIGTMMVGLFAVLFAVIYKANDGPEALPSAVLDVPADFTARSVSLADGRLAMLGADGEGGQRVLVFDANTGALISDYSMASGAVPAQ
jgi:hypothetical protein